MESDWNQSLSFMEIKMNIQKKIAEELKIKEWQVESVIKLIDEGNTIPFIARYRKEAHGSLDDEQLRNLSERLTYLRNLEDGAADEVHDVRLLLFMGILGLAANVGSIFILAGQSEDNMNMKAAFLEVMNDALGSVAVIVSAIVLISTGWAGFDAVAGGIIALMMIPRAFVLLRNAVRVLLEETPQELDLDEVREHLEQVPHVVAVHDLHASTVSTGMPVVMAHVVVERGLTMDDAADILSQLQNCLREHFPVSVPHTTFQLEPEGYDSDSRKELHS